MILTWHVLLYLLPGYYWSWSPDNNMQNITFHIIYEIWNHFCTFLCFSSKIVLCYLETFGTSKPKERESWKNQPEHFLIENAHQVRPFCRLQAWRDGEQWNLGEIDALLHFESLPSMEGLMIPSRFLCSGSIHTWFLYNCHLTYTLQDISVHSLREELKVALL